MSRVALLWLCLLIVLAVGFVVLQLPFDIEDIKIQQAVIAGTVVATGWLMTFSFRETSELIERNQRGRDLQKALRAEIEDYFEALDDEDSDATIENLRAKFMGAKKDDEKIPVFFPLVSEPVIFNTLSQDIHILPENVINDTIRFYSMLSDIRLFAEDLRSTSFANLSLPSQLLAFEDYIEMRIAGCLFAYDAMKKLDFSLDEVITDPDVVADRLHFAERAKLIRDGINNRGADRAAHA